MPEARQRLPTVSMAAGSIINGWLNSQSSMAIAEKVVERQLNAADQQKLIDQFINDLGDAL